MNAIEIEPELDEDEAIEQLDEIYGEVSICGITYSSGKALLELDPIAFRQAQLDLEDNLLHKYECEACGEQYDNEDEADDCCKEECKECGLLQIPTDLIDGLCEECRENKEEDDADS